VESIGSGGRCDMLQHRDGSTVSVHGHGFLSERKPSSRSSNTTIFSSQASLLDLSPRIDQVCFDIAFSVSFAFIALKVT
jgi:hypothetical protein